MTEMEVPLPYTRNKVAAVAISLLPLIQIELLHNGAYGVPIVSIATRRKKIIVIVIVIVTVRVSVIPSLHFCFCF